ncbi:MAG: hypothetical protein ACLTZH_02525 [Subdoligranulum sp.]
MSEWLPAGQSTQNAAQSDQQSQTAAEYEQHLETRLAALIRAMDGAGETVVMVTLDCGEETTYAADTRTEKTSEDTRMQRRQPAYPSAGRCTAGGAVGSGTAGARRGRALPGRG